MDWNNINTDKDTSGLGPIEYDQSKVPSLIRKHADNVRGKSYGQQVREAQARNAELAGLIASEADLKATNADLLSKDTQNRFKDQIEGTTNSDEIIDARRPVGGEAYDTLNLRLEADLAKGFENTRENLTRRSVDITWFGAKGDGLNDDAPAIRKAYAHLKSLGGGVLFFPMPENYYSIQSTAVPYTNKYGLVHDSDNITFMGVSDDAGIRADIALDAIIYSEYSNNYLAFEKMRLNGNNLAKYCYNSAEVYTPYLSVSDSQFYNATETAFNAYSFVAVFKKSIFANSKIGWSNSGVGENIATSTTLISCYALNNSEAGFKSKNLRYSTFVSCAVDNMPNGIAYDIEGRGISLVGCGTENVKQPFRSNSFRGLTISSFWAYDVGSSDSASPTEYLIELVTGTNATISGFHVDQKENVNKYYNYKLGVTTGNYGYENVTVLDNSIRRGEYFEVSNFGFEKPVKLIRGGESQKDETVSVAVTDLPKYLKSLEGYVLNHKLTVNLTGTVQDSSAVNLITKIRGAGKLVIQGNSSDRTIVKLNGSYQKLRIIDNSPLIVLKNLTSLAVNAGGGVGFDLVHADNSRVILDNVHFNGNNMNRESNVYAINGAEVYGINGTSQSGGAIVGTANKADFTSKIAIQ